MTAASGSLAFAQWVTSDGTTTLTGDFRNMNYTPTIETYDQTAGADAALSYITGRVGGQFSFSAVLQTTEGSALLAGQLVEGKIGTMTWGEQGSVSTKIKHVAPFICQGVKMPSPYNNVIEYTADFLQNGSRTDGTF